MLAMKTLNEHIKKGEYQKVYLIYGEEEYLKNQYRDRMKGMTPLITAILKEIARKQRMLFQCAKLCRFSVIEDLL